MADGERALDFLKRRRDEAWQVFAAHVNPGNLRPAQLRAFKYKNMAYLLLLRAAQIELDAEQRLSELLAAERMQG